MEDEGGKTLKDCEKYKITCTAEGKGGHGGGADWPGIRGVLKRMNGVEVFLDMGFGEGRWLCEALRHFPKAKVTGVEVSENCFLRVNQRKFDDPDRLDIRQEDMFHMKTLADVKPTHIVIPSPGFSDALQIKCLDLLCTTRETLRQVFIIFNKKTKENFNVLGHLYDQIVGSEVRIPEEDKIKYGKTTTHGKLYECNDGFWGAVDSIVKDDYRKRLLGLLTIADDDARNNEKSYLEGDGRSIDRARNHMNIYLKMDRLNRKEKFKYKVKNEGGTKELYDEAHVMVWITTSESQFSSSHLPFWWLNGLHYVIKPTKGTFDYAIDVDEIENASMFCHATQLFEEDVVKREEKARREKGRQEKVLASVALNGNPDQCARLMAAKLVAERCAPPKKAMEYILRGEKKAEKF